MVRHRAHVWCFCTACTQALGGLTSLVGWVNDSANYLQCWLSPVILISAASRVRAADARCAYLFIVCRWRTAGHSFPSIPSSSRLLGLSVCSPDVLRQQSQIGSQITLQHVLCHFQSCFSVTVKLLYIKTQNKRLSFVLILYVSLWPAEHNDGVLTSR